MLSPRSHKDDQNLQTMSVLHVNGPKICSWRYADWIQTLFVVFFKGRTIVLKMFPAEDREFRHFDEWICGNAGQISGCNVSSAILKSDIVQQKNLSPSFLRAAYKTAHDDPRKLM